MNIFEQAAVDVVSTVFVFVINVVSAFGQLATGLIGAIPG